MTIQTTGNVVVTQNAYVLVSTGKSLLFINRGDVTLVFSTGTPEVTLDGIELKAGDAIENSVGGSIYAKTRTAQVGSVSVTTLEV